MDSEEAALASSLPPLFPNLGPRNELDGGADDDRGGDADAEDDGQPEDGEPEVVGGGQGSEEEESDQGEEGEEEDMKGFLDNGVCFSFFSMKYELIFLP